MEIVIEKLLHVTKDLVSKVITSLKVDFCSKRFRVSYLKNLYHPNSGVK